MTEQPEGYGLVMPFLPVKSKGGPHDDDAYVAGYEAGLLDAELKPRKWRVVSRTLHEENWKQADLIAMRHGYTSIFVSTRSHKRRRPAGVSGAFG